MPNLIITTDCNQTCDYCFASDLRKKILQKNRHMSMEMFLKILRFLENSEKSEIRFLGGEPTLHPLFTKFLEHAFQKERPIKIFSNGFINEPVMEYLLASPIQKGHILININGLSTYTPEKIHTLKSNLKKLGPLVTCGFNISSPQFNATHLVEWIKSFDLYPAIRLGLAHPTITGQNTSLDWKERVYVAKQIVSLGQMADSQDIIIGLDCGFTLCMFEGLFDQLIRLRIDARFNCRPVVDITPDGQVWHCLSLWGHHGTFLDHHDDLKSINQYFQKKYESIRGFGIMDECRSCKYMRTLHCTGGCLSRNLRQWA